MKPNPPSKPPPSVVTGPGTDPQAALPRKVRRKPWRKAAAWVLLIAAQLAAVLFAVEFLFLKFEKNVLVRRSPATAEFQHLSHLGFNDHVGLTPRKKPDGEFRVLVFGDSFTHAVTQPDFTFCAVLQDRLNAAGLDRTVRVVNLGQPGTTFTDYLEQYYFWTRALEYDAVVFDVYLGNDFQDILDHPQDVSGFAARLAEIQKRGWPHGLGVVMPSRHAFRFMDYIHAYVLTRLQNLPWARRLLFFSCLEGTAHAAEAAPEPNPSHRTDPRYKTYMELDDARYLQAMRTGLAPFLADRTPALAPALPWFQALIGVAAREEARGKPVLLMLSPPQSALPGPVRERACLAEGVASGDVDPALPARMVRDLAMGAGVAVPDVLNLAACLADKTPSGADTYARSDSHWSVEGNAWVGEILAAHILPRWFGRPTGAESCPFATVAAGLPEFLMHSPRTAREIMQLVESKGQANAGLTVP